MSIAFKSPTEAAKAGRRLYHALRNRGFKAQIDADGKKVGFAILGVFVKRARGTKRAAKAKASRTVLVRVRKGRGWTYREFKDSASANELILGVKGEVEAYTQIPIVVETVSTKRLSL